MATLGHHLAPPLLWSSTLTYSGQPKKCWCRWRHNCLNKQTLVLYNVATEKKESSITRVNEMTINFLIFPGDITRQSHFEKLVGKASWIFLSHIVELSSCSVSWTYVLSCDLSRTSLWRRPCSTVWTVWGVWSRTVPPRRSNKNGRGDKSYRGARLSGLKDRGGVLAASAGQKAASTREWV